MSVFRKLFSTTLKNETIESLRDLSYFEKKDKNQIIDDAIVIYREIPEVERERLLEEAQKNKK